MRPQLPPDFPYFGVEEEPLSAVFVRRARFDVFPAYVSRRVVAVRCTTAQREWFLVAAYAPPHCSIEPTLDEISACLDNHKTPQILIMGDFNAKHAMWGPRANDNRGSRVIEFAAARELIILNDAAYPPPPPPTYCNIYTASWIDLTLATPALVRRGYRWSVSSDVTFSEHRAIDLVLHSASERGRRLTKCGRINFVAELRDLRWFARASGANIGSPQALEATINKMYEVIDNTRRKHLRPVLPHRPGKSWWTPDLQIEKKRTRALRRRFQRCQDDALRPFHRQRYCKALAKFRRRIENAKASEARERCAECSRKSLFSAPFRAAFGREKGRPPLPPLTTPDGGRTESVLQSAALLLNVLIAKDDARTDLPEHKELRE
ncbi:uncharacterized protein LOC142563427 [Dermacentor variabilis]|uniref:uncharacterized protein LOC142563427 n=1 Tax=Dermacentor variabilis TaxID=34621 RepID=UPI003F5BEB62